MTDARELLHFATKRPWVVYNGLFVNGPPNEKGHSKEVVCQMDKGARVYPRAGIDAELIVWLANNAERLLEIEAAARAYRASGGEGVVALDKALSIPEAELPDAQPSRVPVLRALREAADD